MTRFLLFFRQASLNVTCCRYNPTQSRTWERLSLLIGQNYLSKPQEQCGRSWVLRDCCLVWFCQQRTLFTLASKHLIWEVFWCLPKFFFSLLCLHGLFLFSKLPQQQIKTKKRK